VLLSKVAEAIRAKGYAVCNIDATVLAQAPRLAPYIAAMRENVARVCGIAAGDVSVKATTEEGMGFSGRGEGIAAHAVCLIENI
jgi:2-C-methyl-D-erythritol 2,4-cyclodiphosphate synthase